MNIFASLFIRYALPALVLSGAVGFGVHKYNDSIRAQAIIDTRAEVEAEYKPKFESLTTQFKDLETNIINSRLAAKQAADLAVAKEKERADNAERKFKSEALIARNFALDIQASFASIDSLPSSMWNTEDRAIASTDSGNQRNTTIVGFVKRLGKRYEGCERDLETALRTAARETQRAAERGAAVDALRRTP